jgi:fructose-specific phosphotransferase system IIC component
MSAVINFYCKTSFVAGFIIGASRTYTNTNPPEEILVSGFLGGIIAPFVIPYYMFKHSQLELPPELKKVLEGIVQQSPNDTSHPSPHPPKELK